MSLVNYSTREITCKIVYYGAGRSGKTTNLQNLHTRIAAERRGPMVSLATEADRTLFFDFLPVELGAVSGFRTRLQLYTVPGQVYYTSTRKLVLQGADGVVFVADSQRIQQTENLESFRDLQVNLLEQGIDPREFPTCIQYNKQDHPDALAPEVLDRLLNFRDLPSFGASALQGTGVFETLRGITELVLQRMAGSLDAPVADG